MNYPAHNLIARWQAVFDHVDRLRVGMVVLERYPSAACLAKPGELQVMINCHQVQAVAMQVRHAEVNLQQVTFLRPWPKLPACNLDQAISLVCWRRVTWYPQTLFSANNTLTYLLTAHFYLPAYFILIFNTALCELHSFEVSFNGERVKFERLIGYW